VKSTHLLDLTHIVKKRGPMASRDNRAFDDQILVQYLLGALPDEETERLDELSIADEIENDLGDAYARGELSGDTLRQFEASYLSSPRRRRKVELAKGLLVMERKLMLPPGVTHIGKVPVSIQEEKASRRFRWSWFSSANSKVQWGFASATLVALAAMGFFFVQNVRLKRELIEAQAQHLSLDHRVQDLEHQLNQDLQELAQARDLDHLGTASLFLPAPTRGASRVPTISLHPETDLVIFAIALESNDFPTYRAALKDLTTNQTVWLSANLEASSGEGDKTVSVTFRAVLLKQRNYILELTGISAAHRSEHISRYPFRVAMQ
jgi:hypothetical protein